ncbi:MAG TPA: hypothetical protein VHR17_10125, partial [Thermoanaerobaculia bacterium]|nr:hypothetical protein [Thermoanaerobaculia bacterium]
MAANLRYERADRRRRHAEPDGGTRSREVRALSAGGDGGGSERSPWYTLFLLILCHLFNDIDRNILSIVAEDIKS